MKSQSKKDKKTDWKGAIISSLSLLVKSEQFKEAAGKLIIKILGLQISGGFRGWLIKNLLKHFRDEVVDVVVTTVDYVEIKHEANETVEMEDRDDATTRLNDILRL